MDTINFYHDHLNLEGQKAYMALVEYLTAERQYPLAFPGSFSADAVQKAYSALYLDRPFLWLPPPKFMLYKARKGEVEELSIDSRYKQTATAEKIAQCDLIADQYIKDAFENKCDPQYRYFLNYLAKKFYENSCYRLTNNGVGESLFDILQYHSGYCVGFSRATKYICDKVGVPCVCVNGAIRKAFSAFLNPDDMYADLPHMWNAIYDSVKKQWLFFDVTSRISFPSAKIKKELNTEFYRNNYCDSKNEFRKLDFLTLGAVQKVYTLDNKEFFL